jgi:hypothetical protein
VQHWSPPHPRKAYASAALDAGVEPEPVATAPVVATPAVHVDTTTTSVTTDGENSLPPIAPAAPPSQD